MGVERVSVPNAIFEAFTLLRVFVSIHDGLRIPNVTFDALILLMVFPPPMKCNAVDGPETAKEDVVKYDISSVSKLNFILSALDVNPALIILVVVIEFAE
jgi:hypothetical protein